MSKLWLIIVCLAIAVSAFEWEDEEEEDTRIRSRRSPFIPSIVNQIIEGLSLANDAKDKAQRISALRYEIKKQIRNNTLPECSCSGPLDCACCVQFEGLELGCVNATIIPYDRQINTVVIYGGREVLTTALTQNWFWSINNCSFLPEPIDPVRICMHSSGITRSGNGFKGCFRLSSGDIGFNHCITYENGSSAMI